MTTVIRTVCAHDCPDMCSILAHVDEGRLVGILTESDLFRALTVALGAGTGLRITFDVSENEDPVIFAVELARKYKLRVASVWKPLWAKA